MSMRDNAYRWLDVLPEDRLPELLGLFAAQWWTSGRAESDVRRMLDRSDVVVAAHREPGPLLGFARALTDETYLAIVIDVIVAREEQGRGLGRLVMERVLADPRIAGVQSVELVCQPALRSFYRRFGFTEQVGASGLMRRTRDPRLRTAPPA